MSVAEDMRLNYEAGLRLIPKHMHAGIVRYIERGVEPGSFLYSLLRGETERAFVVADPANKASKEEWRRFFSDHLPLTCCGSPLKVSAWMAMGGLSGMPDGK